MGAFGNAFGNSLGLCGSQTKPLVPTDFAVTEVFGGYDLSWISQGAEVEIYKAIDAYNYLLIATITGNTYSDVTPIYGMTKYKIRSKKNGLFSAFTNSITKTAPYNLVKGEGTATPSFLPWPFGTVSGAIVPTLQDNIDGPFQTIYPKKRRVAGTGTGSMYISQSAIYLPNPNPTIISFGFWVNDADIAAAYTTTGSTSAMNLWLYKGGITHNLSFTVRTIIASVGNNETGTFSQTGVASGFYKVVCLGKSNGYSYIVITWHTITWTLANSDTNTIILYMLYSNIVLNGKKIDYLGFTWLFNNEIISANPHPDSTVTLGDMLVNRILHATNNDVWLRFAYNNTYDLLLNVHPFEDVPNNNFVCNDYKTLLCPKSSTDQYIYLTISSPIIHNTADDAAPVQLSSGYVGANHGNVRNRQVSFLVNGNVPIIGDVDIKVKGSYVDIIESYDIVNPANSLQNIMSVVINRKYFANGTQTISTELTFNYDANINYAGFVQSIKLATATGLTKVKMFIPKSLTIGGYAFNTVADFTSNPASVLNFTADYWADANSPVDRVTQFLATAADARQHAFSMGYIPEYGEMINRKDKVTNAWSFFTTSKSYPHGIDSKINPIAAGSVYRSKAFRKYFDVSAMPTGRVDSYFIEDGLNVFLYADYNGVISDSIAIPTEYQGKTITLVEKSSNVSYTDIITGATLAVNVTTATPLTGYLVLKFN